MHFSALKEEWIRVLRLVGGPAERKISQSGTGLPMPGGQVLMTPLPSLSTLRFTANDLDLQIEADLRPIRQESSQGRWGLPYRKLFDSIRSLPEDAILDGLLEEKRLTLRSGKFRIQLNVMQDPVFPVTEPDAPGSEWVLNADELRQLLQKVYFAVADGDVRRYLNGLWVEWEPKTLTVVGTDAHRLAYWASERSWLKGISSKVILPKKTIQEALRFLEDFGADVRVLWSDRQFQIKTSMASFTSHLLNAKYPDYKRLLPDRALLKTAIIEKEALKQVLQRATAFLGDKNRGVQFCFDRHLLAINAVSDEQDHFEESLEMVYESDPCTMGFNAKYLIDYLNVIESKHVKLGIQNENSSSFLSTEASSDPSYVLMPMRI